MTRDDYVIGEPCVDVLDRACEPVCPVEAIYYEDDLPDKWQVYTEENAHSGGSGGGGRSGWRCPAR